MKEETEKTDTNAPAAQPGKAKSLKFMLAVPQKHPDESGREFADRAIKHLAGAYREKERKQQLDSESETPKKGNLYMNSAYQQTVFQVIPERLPDSFCVITAWNPDGKIDHSNANRRRDLELVKKIDSLALSKTRITGMSPDELHGEQGWAVACSQEEGLKLGCEFRQEGIYFVENDELNLVDCGDGRSESLGSFSSRVRDPLCEKCFVISIVPPQGKEKFQVTEQLEVRIRVAKHFQRFTLRQAEETGGNRSTDILEISVTTHRTEDVITLAEDLLHSFDQPYIQIVHNGIAQRLHEWNDPDTILEVWGLS